ALPFREALQVLLVEPPADLGVPAERAGAAARRIHEHLVEDRGERGLARVAAQREDRPRPVPRGVVDETAEPRGAAVARDHEPSGDEALRELERLRAWRRAQVEHARTDHASEHAGYELRRLVLRPREPPRERFAV